MSHSITIVGSSAAVNEPWAKRFGFPDLLVEDGSTVTDQNFALTASGLLWQVVASRRRAEQGTAAWEALHILRHAAKTRAALELLRSWREGDQIEQGDTLQLLKVALDENRAPGNKLFERG